MNAPRTASLTVALLLTASVDLFAQQELSVAPGDRVRVSRLGTVPPLVCTVLALKADTLVLDAGDDATPLILALTDVKQLEVSRGRKSNTLMGLGIGFLAGAGLGAAIGGAIDCEEAGLNDEWSCVGLLAAVGAVGGLGAGALAGSAIRTDRWEEVVLDELRVGLSPVTPDGVAVSVAFPLRL